ncbi:hypothetical protein AOLI_G00136280 [Acnodon oligacanthus]
MFQGSEASLSSVQQDFTFIRALTEAETERGTEAGEEQSSSSATQRLEEGREELTHPTEPSPVQESTESHRQLENTVLQLRESLSLQEVELIEIKQLLLSNSPSSDPPQSFTASGRSYKASNLASSNSSPQKTDLHIPSQNSPGRSKDPSTQIQDPPIADPAHSEPAPTDSESRSVHSEVPQRYSEPQIIHSDPCPTQVKICPAYIDPKSTHSEPQNTHSESQPAYSTTSTTHSRPEPTNSKVDPHKE